MRIARRSEWSDIRRGAAPRHLGVIMDGNGRWAEGRGDPRWQGYCAAQHAVAACVDAAADVGIEYCTFYAFSSENWQRPPDDLSVLLRFSRWLWPSPVLEALHRSRARTRLLGDLEDARLPSEQFVPLLDMARKTDEQAAVNVTFAVNYGARRQPQRGVALEVVNTHAEKTPQSSLSVRDVDLPDLDVVFRTGGEQRLSNFMLWHAAYAELIFTDTLWPDFRAGHLYSIVAEYQHRVRTFGTVDA